jgi:hypothetical protein
MEKIGRAELKDLVEYEKQREAMRAAVIALKARRRISVGDRITLLFENRETVLFQIQEMIRTERIVDDAKIQDELDAYNALIPGPGELSATLFIEIPELIHMTQEEVRRTVNLFQGLDREAVWLALGDSLRIPAQFEPGHTKEEKMAAVHYVRFAVPAGARAALADPGATARLLVEHSNYEAETAIPAELREEMLEDLA